MSIFGPSRKPRNVVFGSASQIGKPCGISPSSSTVE
jgi:hypothetical protein